LLCLSSTATSQAQKFSQAQQNAMNHVAQVFAASTECPEYQANTARLAIIGMVHNFSINDENVQAFVIAKMKEHQAGLTVAGAAGCLVAWALYGPGGQNVPHLLSRR
jgi:hypothetical protein